MGTRRIFPGVGKSGIWGRKSPWGSSDEALVGIREQSGSPRSRRQGVKIMHRSAMHKNTTFPEGASAPLPMPAGAHG